MLLTFPRYSIFPAFPDSNLQDLHFASLAVLGIVDVNSVDSAAGYPGNLVRRLQLSSNGKALALDAFFLPLSRLKQLFSSDECPSADLDQLPLYSSEERYGSRNRWNDRIIIVAQAPQMTYDFHDFLRFFL
jgi:hypothetical protein